MPRHYTKAERALIILGALNNIELENINQMLLADQLRTGSTKRELSERSYELLQEAYIPAMLDEAYRDETKGPDQVEAIMGLVEFGKQLWYHVISPKTLTEINKILDKYDC